MAKMVDSGPRPSHSEDMIAEDLTQVIRDTIHAINTRDFASAFNKGHPVWKRFAPNFTAEPEYLSSASAKEYQQPLPVQYHLYGYKVHVVGPERIQEMFSRVTDAYPGYRIQLTSEISTAVHERARWASSYVMMETLDMPPGVIRPSVGLFEWKKIDGNWLMSKYEGMAGIGAE